MENDNDNSKRIMLHVPLVAELAAEIDVFRAKQLWPCKRIDVVRVALRKFLDEQRDANQS